MLLVGALIPVSSLTGSAAAETFLGWQVAEGTYLAPYTYGGAYSESNGIITLMPDDRAAGPTLCKDFSPKTDFEISLQVRAETLSPTGGPLSGGSGEGLRLMLQDKGVNPSKGINLEVRGRNGGEFWMVYRSARCDIYGWECDIVPFVHNNQQGLRSGALPQNATDAVVQAGAWYTMQLTVHQSPYSMTGEVFSENGTLLGSLTIRDITNFSFEDIKSVVISSLCGGTFQVKNFTLTSIGDESLAEDDIWMDWRVREQGGHYSASNDSMRLWTDEAPTNASVLYRKISLRTDFEISLQLKAPKMESLKYRGTSLAPRSGEFKVGFRSDDIGFSESSSHELDSYGTCGDIFMGSRNLTATEQQGNTTDSHVSRQWRCYEFEYGFPENTWYTITIEVQRNPFSLSTMVAAENGSFLCSFSNSGKDDPGFDYLNFVYLTPCVEGEFYIRNISVKAPDADFAFSPAEAIVNSPVVFTALETIESYGQSLDYTWDFGDGNITLTQEPTISHVYAVPCTLNVTLTVTDPLGEHSFKTKVVSVRAPAYLSISAVRSADTAGATVNVYGKLYEPNGAPLTNKTVVLSYDFEGANATFHIGSEITDDSGDYSTQWISPGEGTFTLYVEWPGDENHPRVVNGTALTFLPYESQQTFMVESNSTVTSMNFNSTTNELAFTVSGPLGSQGYVRATVAKSLLPKAENVKVLLDGRRMNYTLMEIEDSWVLLFTYSHSTHKVSIYYVVPQESQTNPVNPALNVDYALLAIIVLVILALATIGMSAIRRNDNASQS